MLRLLPEFVERQDLAPADRSPRCINVDDDRFFAGELLVEIRLVVDVEFNLLRLGGQYRQCEQSKHQREKLFHGQVEPPLLGLMCTAYAALMQCRRLAAMSMEFAFTSACAYKFFYI
jgi:hypothetical protein